MKVKTLSILGISITTIAWLWIAYNIGYTNGSRDAYSRATAMIKAKAIEINREGSP